MKKRQVLILCIGLIFTSVYAQSEAPELQEENLDEVTITGSRFKLKREHSGKTVVKINAETLEKNAGNTLADIINTVSGISINGSQSQAGQNLSTYVRGGQNRQVLVLIDGIALSDPSQIENNFDLQLLALDQIESIEILKGASSALYGNRASTAVINITLKKAGSAKLKANFTSSFGTNNGQNDQDLELADFTNSVGLSGTLSDFNYTLNFSNTFTDGLSAIRSVDETTTNSNDPYSKISARAQLGFKLGKQIKISTVANLDKYRSAYDDVFFLSDEDYSSHNKQYRFGLAPQFDYTKGSLHINAAMNKVEREFVSSFPSKFDAKSVVVDAFNKYKFSKQLYSVIGLNYVKTEMNNIDGFTNIKAQTAQDEIVDPYLNLTYISEFGLNLNAGARLNNHSTYGSHFVYNINPSYGFKLGEQRLKLLASYSTAYVTPSLYQLFVPGFGNPNLQAQEDTTLEAGFDLSTAKDKLLINAVYFQRDQKQYIDYVVLDFLTFAGEYQNTNADFKVRGVEMEIAYTPNKKMDLKANYSFTERKNGQILRVPKHKVNAKFAYQISKQTYSALSYQFNGDRTSAAFTDDFSRRRVLHSYSLLNLDVNHRIMDNKLTLFAGVKNMFNADYEEIYRFSTLGRNYRFGFNLKF